MFLLYGSVDMLLVPCSDVVSDVFAVCHYYVTTLWLYNSVVIVWCRDGSVGTAMGYRLDGRGSIPGRDFSLLHNVQTVSGAHSSYRMSTSGSFPRGKAPTA
jgi:hypothetical protein